MSSTRSYLFPAATEENLPTESGANSSPSAQTALDECEYLRLLIARRRAELRTLKDQYDEALLKELREMAVRAGAA